jgi:CHAD domain-containing protein
MRVLETVEAAGTLYAPEPLHRVRIAAKKFRYALEIARDLADVSAGGPLASVKAVQDRLGRIHDLHVLEQRVRSMARPGGRRAGATVRHALLSELERECREQHAAYLSRRDLLVHVARVAAHVTSAGVAGRRRPIRMKLGGRTARVARRIGRLRPAAGFK